MYATSVKSGYMATVFAVIALGCNQCPPHVEIIGGDTGGDDSETETMESTDTGSDSEPYADTDEMEEPPRGWVARKGALKFGDVWARGFGGTGQCESHAVEIGPDGAVYVTGWFTGAVDFDPGDGEDAHTSPFNASIFLTRFESTGEYAWTITWGTDNGHQLLGWSNWGYALAIADDGSVYVGGQFSGSIDFDPGPGEALHDTVGFSSFLLKLHFDQSFSWGTTWKNAKGRVTDISLSEESVFVSGQAGEGTDFGLDEGAEQALEWVGEEYYCDCYATGLTIDGRINWVRVWGGDRDEYNCRSAPLGDGIVVVGAARGFIKDLDPGPGYDPPDEVPDYADPFLIGFDRDGNRTIAEMWGGSGGDYTDGVATSENAAFVIGELWREMDFGTEEPPNKLTAISETHDAYLLRIEADGTRSWVRSWGGANRTWPNDVAVAEDTVMVVGEYKGEVNFGTEDVPETIASDRDNINSYIRAFDLDGNRTWVRVLPGGGTNAAWSIAARDGAVAVTGAFEGEIDLDLGAGEDVWDSPGLNACYVARFPLEADLGEDN